MKSKKTVTKKVPLSKYVKLEMQFETLKIELNKTISILNATERENHTRGLQIANLGKLLNENQIRHEELEKRLLLIEKDNLKLETDLDRERKMIDFLIKEKE